MNFHDIYTFNMQLYISDFLPLQTEEGDDPTGKSSGSRIPQGIQQADGRDNQANNQGKCIHHHTASKDVRQNHGDTARE